MKQHPSHADWFWWLPAVCEGQSQALSGSAQSLCPQPPCRLTQSLRLTGAQVEGAWCCEVAQHSGRCAALAGGHVWPGRGPAALLQWSVSLAESLPRCRSSSCGLAGLFQRAPAEKMTGTSVSADSLLDDSRPSPSFLPRGSVLPRPVS